MSLALESYLTLLGSAEINELRALAGALKPPAEVLMVNSTAVGGGVAEILDRLVPLARELGVSIRWEVITGGTEFFEITKAIHNALHGGPFELGPEAFDVFLACNEKNRSRLNLDSPFVIIHDPQPLPLIAGR